MNDPAALRGKITYKYGVNIQCVSLLTYCYIKKNQYEYLTDDRAAMIRFAVNVEPADESPVVLVM